MVSSEALTINRSKNMDKYSLVLVNLSMKNLILVAQKKEQEMRFNQREAKLDSQLKVIPPPKT